MPSMIRDARRTRQRRATRIFVSVWLVWGLLLAGIRVAHPGLAIGFDWNDAHILVASDWFRQHGHWSTLLIPPRQTLPRADGTFNLYNTFPPGVFWVHEVRRALGVEALWAHRLAAVAWNQVAVLLLFLLVRRIAASALIAALAASLYMLSGPYATASGGLWEHLPALSLLGTLICWFEFERARAPRARRLWLAATFLLCAIDNCLSVQHTVMVALVIGARAAILARRDRRRGLPWMWPLAGAMIVMAAAPLVMGARFAAQVHLMGGLDPAIAYFTTKLETRMGLEPEAIPPLGAWAITAARFGIPMFELPFGSRSLQGLYPVFHPATLIGGAVLLLAALAVRRSSRLAPVRRGVALGLLLFGTSLSWPVLFPEHVRIHTPVILMFMPGLAIALGSIAALPAFIKPAAAELRLPARPWAAPLLWLASGALVAPTLSTLALSETLNADVQLTRRVFREVQARDGHERAARLAAPFLAGAESLETLAHPITAAELGAPFARLRRDQPRPPDGDPHLVAIRLYEGDGRRIAAAVAGKWGLPRLLAVPGDLFLYGHNTGLPPGARSMSPGIEVAPGVRWREVAFAPTIDQTAAACALLLTSGTSGSVAEFVAQRPRMRIRVVNANGDELHIADATIGTTSASSDRALVWWVQLPKETFDGWARLEIELQAGEASPTSFSLMRDPPELPAP